MDKVGLFDRWSISVAIPLGAQVLSCDEVFWAVLSFTQLALVAVRWGAVWPGPDRQKSYLPAEPLLSSCGTP